MNAGPLQLGSSRLGSGPAWELGPSLTRARRSSRTVDRWAGAATQTTGDTSAFSLFRPLCCWPGGATRSRLSGTSPACPQVLRTFLRQVRSPGPATEGSFDCAQAGGGPFPRPFMGLQRRVHVESRQTDFLSRSLRTLALSVEAAKLGNHHLRQGPTPLAT